MRRGHVRFGAATGGASVILGILLALTALLFGDSISLLLHVFPQTVLGIILSLAGAELAMSSREPGPDRVDRFVVLAIAAFAVWNVGVAVAVVFGFHVYRRGWLNL